MITTLDYNNKKNYTFTGDVNDSIFKPLGFKGNSNPANGFSDDLYDFYIAKQDYANAARYSSMFNYKDKKKEMEHRAWVLETQETAKKRNAVFNSLSNDDEKYLVEFSSAVFDGNAYSTLDSRNPYYQKYNKLFKQLGSDDLDNAPHKLSVTFGADKSKWLGLFDVENDNSFSNFLKNAQYDLNFFHSKDVNVTEANGEKTISFNPNTSVGRKLLYDLAKYSTNSGILPGDKELQIRGYDAQGNPLNNPNTQLRTNFGDLGGQYSTKSIYLLKELADVVDEAKVKEEEVVGKTLKRVYTTNLYGAESADIMMIENAIANAPDEFTKSKLTQRLKDLQRTSVNKLVGSGLSDYKVLSNYEQKDKIMRNVDDTDIRETLKSYISQAWENGSLNYQLAEYNGVFGCYVTLPATIKKGYGNEDGDERPEINIFIENFLSDKAKEAVANDTQYKAIHELDQMEAWGYDHELTDGRKIVVSRAGENKEYTSFLLVDKNGNEEAKNKSDLVKLLNADNIKRDGAFDLYRRYVNINGEVIDEDALETEMKKLAAVIANGFYPDEEEITDIDTTFGLTTDEKLRLSFGMYDKIEAMEKAYRDLLTQFQLLQ